MVPVPFLKRALNVSSKDGSYFFISFPIPIQFLKGPRGYFFRSFAKGSRSSSYPKSILLLLNLALLGSSRRNYCIRKFEKLCMIQKYNPYARGHVHLRPLTSSTFCDVHLKFKSIQKNLKKGSEKRA